MLQALDIRDFALIENLHIEWGSGLNVLTGETGAGKSIIIDALNLVLGGRAALADIRSDAQRTVIEASFKVDSSVATWLRSQELLPDENDATELGNPEGADSQLIVAREISKAGSRARINGTLVNASVLQELRQKLLTIHAQHEARSLLAPQMQLELLDGLGTSNTHTLLGQIRTLYERWKEIKNNVEQMEASEQERAQRLDFASFQYNELEQATLQEEDEFETLQEEHKRLSSTAQLADAAFTAADALSAVTDSDNKRASDMVQEALAQIENVAEFDQQLAAIGEPLKNALDLLEETSRSLQHYRDSVQTDPESMAELEARIDLLAGIKRKYGPTLADAIARTDALAKEIEELKSSENTIAELQQELSEVDSELNSCCQRLSNERKQLAEQLSQSINSELIDLGMEACKFEISFEQTEPGPTGIDRVEMLIAPNPGQPLLPVSKIASGGELSRVMLALKTIFASADKVSTVVFDEIDTGLSGKVLQAVRDKLIKLSKSHQILCITHQPMIASVADNHIQITKTHSEDSTSISVVALEQKDRIKIVASMASGYDDQQEALRFAEALLNDAIAIRSSS
jgi:DNA repair protein RecN (Recombination protein N)